MLCGATGTTRPGQRGTRSPRAIVRGALAYCLLALLALAASGARADRQNENDDAVFPLIKGEQRRIRFRDPATLPQVPIAPTPPPPTVRNPLPDEARELLSLDEAIRIALSNSEVVRRVAGNVAVSTGQTIYDAAITNTTIDQQRAAFDPAATAGVVWSQTEVPNAFFDPLDPLRTILAGTKIANNNVNFGMSQTNLSGGTAQMRVINDASQFFPGLFALNPQNRYATELSYTQPLLRGAGVGANRVPIVLARIDTERSFFQYRNAVQELVRSVVEAYWAVVFARTNVWARGIQVQQAEESYRFTEARQRLGFANLADTAQARAALANFRATLISARADLLTREAVLQNVLGIPPTAPRRFVPTTPPTSEDLRFEWNTLVDVAQVRRPDIIELKLVLEADQQRLILARNQRQPNLNLVGLYRWNGLEGRMPDGTRVGTNGDAFTDWTLGVNFSVPLILRQERATVRSVELLITRDRAAIEQGIHSMTHLLALRLRNLSEYYLNYRAFGEARLAGRENLERQFAAYRVGTEVIFLNVLQAISDWGNSVSQEAQALAQYNIELANIEFDTGTILETHGVFLYEDRFCSLGPLWIRPNKCVLYPRDIHPGPNAQRYPPGTRPSENFLDLDDYPRRLPSTEAIPRRPPPPRGPLENLPPGQPVPEEELPEILPRPLEGPADPHDLLPLPELGAPGNASVRRPARRGPGKAPSAAVPPAGGNPLRR